MNPSRVRSWIGQGLLAIAALAANAATLAAADPNATACDELARVHLEGATITSAHLIDAGTFKLPNGKALDSLPAFCRVEVVAEPSPDSRINIEVWLPADDWNGRLWGVGNGWLAGSISQQGLALRVSGGFAAVATDTGHQAKPTNSDWALGHPEKVVDFGYRGIHLAAVNGKRIVEAFYGKAPGHAYFSSCSNGGRQALMEAQRFPEDYDGIVAGAPAIDWTHTWVGLGVVFDRWLAPGPGYLPAGKIPALHRGVLAACDSSDGIKDGIIGSPQRCGFDPSVLACKGADSVSCLTPEQVVTVRNLYRGVTLHSGVRLLNGYSPASELGWGDSLLGDGAWTGDLYHAVLDFYRNMVLEDPQWDSHSFDGEAMMRLAERKLAGPLNAMDANLTRFISRGGKLVLYHGWGDSLLPPNGTVDYFFKVRKTVGVHAADSAVRLFMVPGMDHCGGGPGSNDFGQFSNGKGDADSNVMAAMQRWVEQGVAPDRINAIRRREQGDPADTVEVRTRPLCAYPKVAKFRGTGSTDEDINFECAIATH